jgi:hypothetical protein
MRARNMHNLAVRPDDGLYLSGAVQEGGLRRIAHIYRLVLTTKGEAEDTGHDIGDITRADSLRAITGDSKGLSAKCPSQEMRDRPVVTAVETRSVHIEDADDMGVESVVAAKGTHKCLGVALGLVVYRRRSNGADIAAGALYRGLDGRITIAVASGCVEVAGIVALGNLEGIQCSR